MSVKAGNLSFEFELPLAGDLVPAFPGRQEKRGHFYLRIKYMGIVFESLSIYDFTHPFDCLVAIAVPFKIV